VLESTSAAPQSTILYFTGWGADGDLLDYGVTRLPSHGVLELNTIDGTTVPITNATFRCWETFSRYRLVWRPEVDLEEPVTICFKAWDGNAYSAEATFTVSLRAQDGKPEAAPASYTINEDTVLFNVSLSANDADSDFVSILIMALPSYGKLYEITSGNNSDVLLQGEEIAQAYSQYEVVPPIEQFATNVRAVSTFWPAGDDAGNGYPSWHPFREQSLSFELFIFFLRLDVLILLCYGCAFVSCSQRFSGRRTRHIIMLIMSLVTVHLPFKTLHRS
jgi:hypothetical protein